jgi:regulator of sirC expression with transglutaminase-like and TPR domain
MQITPHLEHIAEQLQSLARQAPGNQGLAEAALLIAKSNYPGLAVDRYLDKLERIAETIDRGLPGSEPSETAIERINQHLFDDLGYAGNGEDYHNPRNSYLNDVLDQRRGIPITLSVLYMDIARRLGVVIEGVSFPGHFLVIHDSPRGRMVIDPFHHGITLSYRDLRERLAAVMGEEAWSEELAIDPLLQPADRRTILVRMLRNLKGLYAHHEQWHRSLEWVNLILALEPETPEELRDRAIILNKLECPQAAATDYEAYLRLRPQAGDAAQIRQQLERARSAARKLN